MFGLFRFKLYINYFTSDGFVLLQRRLLSQQGVKCIAIKMEIVQRRLFQNLAQRTFNAYFFMGVKLSH